MDKPLAIVGVDPGTTLGYAVLDLEGNVLLLSSSKQLDLDSLISLITASVKPVVTVSDKKIVPNFVKQFSTALQTKMIAPRKDISVIEKKNLTSEFNPKNDHERDALASAIFGLKVLKPLIRKLDLFIINNKQQKIASQLKERVIKQSLAIKKAAEQLEQPKQVTVIKEVIEKKAPEDYLKLRNTIKDLYKQIDMLKSSSNSLKNKMAQLNNQKEALANKLFKPKFEFKDKTAEKLNKIISAKDSEIQILQKETSKLNDFMSKTNKKIILKKLKNLTIGEYNNKNKILNIDSGDVLLVDNPNQYSERLIKLLKDKIGLIISKMPLTKKLQFPFHVLPNKDICIEENELFALADKQEFEKAKSKQDILANIIESYKKERQE